MLSDDPQVTVRREIVRTWTRNKTTRSATRAKVGNGNARVVSYTRVKRPLGSLLLRAFVFSHAPCSTTIEQTKALLLPSTVPLIDVVLFCTRQIAFSFFLENLVAQIKALPEVSSPNFEIVILQTAFLTFLVMLVVRFWC